MRVSSYIDGFNLYHAIDELGRHDLKWLNLWQLCLMFAPRPDHELVAVDYFSAFATWRADAFARHRAFVKALETVGVSAVLGRFKEKDRHCHSCQHAWKDHEEKETDVNIGIRLVQDAYENRFDRALLLTGDSDLTPAVKMIKARFPHKDIRVIAPIGRPFSMELVAAAGQTSDARRLRLVHLEKSLFPAEVCDADGSVVATRSEKHEPSK